MEDWKKQRRNETKAVKTALKKIGINAKVHHGKGTAWGWLNVNIGELQQFGNHFNENGRHECGGYPCTTCIARDKAYKIAKKIVYEASGRNSKRDYGDTVIVETQNHWTDKNGSQPIVHEQFFIDSILLSE